ncbi:hypothetical protein [Synechococcus sp. N5]|uniref:hypothetical protein n=1 Tax=Synechococcus sp. N5 TaxID=2575515 RepID=UPI001483B80F|nr:hypothetical protein [Synechococcus sp. N5]
MNATIAALAEQGLKRCRSEQIASEADMTPATWRHPRPAEGSLPEHRSRSSQASTG